MDGVENLDHSSPARYKIALVQRDVEPLHTPGYDLCSYLSGNSRWLVETFGEAEVNLLSASTEFDCVILSVDSLYRNEAALAVLLSGIPSRGLLVLHQLDERALSFLKGEFALSQQKLQAEAIHAHVSDMLRAPQDEPLFNWPNEIALSTPVGGRCSLASSSLATWSLLADESSAWKTILEVNDLGTMKPVVMRTGLGRAARIVVCYLFLEPRRSAHAQLLENMIVFCSEGTPEVAILDDRIGASATAQKLRLLGANVTRTLRPPDAGRTFDTWPVRAASTVLMESGWATADTSQATRRWLARGGTIVRADQAGGLAFQYGSADQQWLGRQWAACLKSIDPATWHGGSAVDGQERPGSIWKTRSVFRVLERLYQDPHADPESLGLEPPSAYRDVAGQLLARRVGDLGDFDHTISTTAAACDIATIVGETGFPLDATRKWLLSRFRDAQAEDRLDIARTLARGDLLEETYDQLLKDMKDHRTWHPLLICRLLAAATSCGIMPSQVRPVGIVADADELDTNLVLAAEYLNAEAQFRKTEDLAWLERDDVLRALRTLQRLGHLVRAGESGVAASTVELEVLCTEALAVHSVLAIENTATYLILRRDLSFSPYLVDAVLEQNNQILLLARQREKQLRDEQADLKALGRVRHVFGVLAALVALSPIVGVLLKWGFSPPDLAFGAILSIGMYAALLFVLDWLRLRPGWTSFLLSPLQNGLSGLPRWVAARIHNDKEETHAVIESDNSAGKAELRSQNENANVDPALPAIRPFNHRRNQS
jgi:hypothetical protein